MRIARRLTLVAVVVVLIAAAGIGVGYALDLEGMRDSVASAIGDDPADAAVAVRAPAPEPVDAGPVPAEDPVAAPTVEPRVEPGPSAKPKPSPKPEPKPAPEPEPQAGPPLLSPGEQGPEVRDLQARLRQIQWFNTDVTGYYGEVTTEAVTGFQAKREIAVTGYVDDATWQRLAAMTTEPTADELANRVAAPTSNVAAALDTRCTTGRVLCIDKTNNTMRWVVDGTVGTTLDVRFGAEYTPTREGSFVVDFKSRDHVSSLYGSPMPFAMFFSRGQAVHYSSDFAAVGYGGASHGCVNVRDYDALAALYDQVRVGDTVIVYRS